MDKNKYKKEYCITENTSTECIVQKSKNLNIKEEITNEPINSMTEKIQIEMKKEKIIKNVIIPENSPSDFNFLCENELELDQIPIYEMTPPSCILFEN